jgi:hypothetical protein
VQESILMSGLYDMTLSNLKCRLNLTRGMKIHPDTAFRLMLLVKRTSNALIDGLKLLVLLITHQLMAIYLRLLKLIKSNVLLKSQRSL